MGGDGARVQPRRSGPGGLAVKRSRHQALDDWLTDCVARHPSGPRAREIDGADDVHDFARLAIIDVLVLGPDEHLVELGCGGGLLLHAALATRARVTGIDHSEKIVALARLRDIAVRNDGDGELLSARA